MPFLRAPYYVWVGHVPQLATVLAENKVEAPPMFPPTFLYTMSWEDPRPDMEVRMLPPSSPPLCLSRQESLLLCHWCTSGGQESWHAHLFCRLLPQLCVSMLLMHACLGATWPDVVAAAFQKA